MLFEDVAVETIVATASPGWLAIFTDMITNIITDSTPVGNNGLVHSPLCKQCQPKHLLAHGGHFLQLVFRLVLPVEYEKHRLRPAND